MAKKKVEVLDVKILVAVAGVYKLSASVGDVVSYPIALAMELVENKYAEIIK